MTQYSTPEAQPAPAPHRFSALAWTSLILGIVGIVGSPIIFLNNLTAVVAAVGVILGIIALFGTRKVLAGIGTALFGTRKVLAGIGTALFGTRKVLAGIGTALCVAAIAFTVAAQGAVTEEFTGTSLVTYQVESSTGTVDISYDAGNSFVSETGRPSPWTRDVQASNFAQYFSVSLPFDSGEGSVTCRIVKDGEVVAEQTATGQYASVSCSTP